MEISCFYEPCCNLSDEIKKKDRELISMWQKTWSYYGWEPRVYQLKDIINHPKYEDVSKKVSSFPTVNDLEYEKMCYVRWLCMIDKTGWFTDYDVMNYGFRPTSFGNKLVCAGRHLGGSSLYATKNMYKKFIDVFLNFIADEKSVHFSDMIILNYVFNYDCCFLNIEDQHYSESLLLQHYSNNLYGRVNKNKIIKQDLRYKKICHELL